MINHPPLNPAYVTGSARQEEEKNQITFEQLVEQSGLDRETVLKLLTMKVLDNKDAEIAGLRVLCGEAADALQYYCDEVKSLSLKHYELIEELRKAAQ